VTTYVLRRVFLLVPTLLGMSVFIFLMLRLLPGDVIAANAVQRVQAAAGDLVELELEEIGVLRNRIA